MSSRGVTGTPLRGYVRNSRRRKTVLEVDLSVPPSENRNQVGTSGRANSRDVAPGQQGRSVPPAPIDVEAFDDDVVISSPRAFTERENAQSVEPPPPPPPKERIFSCPVCMGPLVEEMSTKCGHIFCKACIKAAIAAQGKCPTCRRKATMKDTIRIYLPATN
ncbi:RING/U-box superfamily protein [Actinidia rufa]|uniref:RING/U-box superfamily protein n=1 Tax=Actinidia rufa TaxID=165716 RepID=A0A7J0GRN4_9ERIC|nr:RING/U-box superfamily protein [Actinidia rufa]